MVSASGDDLGGDPADAGAGQADGTSRARGEVEHSAMDERAAVVDGDDDAPAAMGDPQPGAERQRAVSAGHGVLVEALSGGSLAAGFIAVERRHAGEAVAARGAHRGVGIPPVAAGRLGGMVVVAMVPGFGGSLGNAAADQESCGNQRESRTRPG